MCVSLKGLGQCREASQVLPSIYIQPREDTNADRDDNTANIDSLGACAHLFIVLRQDAQPVTDEGWNQQLRRNECRGKPIRQRLNGGEG